MAFVNLPPNLKDMFYSLSDRISKLETGPNQAMYTAETAQGSSAAASAQAAQAYNEALIAGAEATQATYEAGVALQSANGKSVVHYSTSGPSGGGNNGDVWFQVNGSGIVQYQYVYNAGSWNNTPVSNTVIANLDAGKITAGTITGIAYNNGSGTFYVDPSGNLTATSATVQGTIRGNSGYFTGTITSTAGSIGGWSISSSQIYNGSGASLNATNGNITGSDITAFGAIYGYGNISTATGQDINSGRQITALGSATFGQASGLFEFLSSSGNVRVSSTYGNSVSGRTMLVSTTGLYGTSASTERKKHNIEPYAIDANALLQLEPVTFNYLESIDEDQNPEYGFIAEDADRLGLFELVGYDQEGLPDYFAYEKLPVFLLQIIKNQEQRITELENKLTNP